MLFADDLVIIAETETELRLKLQKLGEYINEKDLQINLDKSEIMRLNDQQKEKKKWEMYNKAGEVIGQLEENNVYKYMGIRLGSGRRYLYQKRHSQNWLPRALGLFNVRARPLARDIISQSKLWCQVQKPGLLYGSNVICYDKGWTNSLESTQHKIGCKILGVAITTSQTGVRGELGWPTVEGEIAVSKLRYKGSILHMGKNRWPAIIFQQIKENPTDWMEEVEKIENKFGIYQADYLMNRWKKVIQAKYRNVEQNQWVNQVKNSTSLRYYQKSNLFELGRFADGSDDGRRMTRFRISSLGKRVAEKIKCNLCNQVCEQMVVHLLQDCEMTKDESVNWVRLVETNANRNDVPRLITQMTGNMTDGKKKHCLDIMKKLE